jgi:hypothetical protein
VQEFRGPCATRRPAPEADGSRVKRTSRTGSYRSPSRSAPKNKRRPGYVRRIKNKCFPRPHPRTGLRGGRRHRAARRFHGHGSTRVPPRMQIRRISGARRKKDEERAPRDPILDFPASTSQPRLPSPSANKGIRAGVEGAASGSCRSCEIGSRVRSRAYLPAPPRPSRPFPSRGAGLIVGPGFPGIPAQGSNSGERRRRPLPRSAPTTYTHALARARPRLHESTAAAPADDLISRVDILDRVDFVDRAQECARTFRANGQALHGRCSTPAVMTKRDTGRGWRWTRAGIPAGMNSFFPCHYQSSQRAYALGCIGALPRVSRALSRSRPNLSVENCREAAGEWGGGGEEAKYMESEILAKRYNTTANSGWRFLRDSFSPGCSPEDAAAMGDGGWRGQGAGERERE